MAEVVHLTGWSTGIRIDEATGDEFNVSLTPSVPLHSVNNTAFALSFQVKYNFTIPRDVDPTHYTELSKTWDLPVPASQQALILEEADTWLSLAGVDLLDARNFLVQAIFGPDAMTWARDDISAVTVQMETGSFSSPYIDNDEELLRAQVEISMSEYNPTRKAASVEAVEALEKVEGRDAERETSCVVCLTEFSLGDEMKKMPCSHVFHGDCIAKWLEYQCVCPLCHFELPS